MPCQSNFHKYYYCESDEHKYYASWKLGRKQLKVKI